MHDVSRQLMLIENLLVHQGQQLQLIQAGVNNLLRVAGLTAVAESLQAETDKLNAALAAAPKPVSPAP